MHTISPTSLVATFNTVRWVTSTAALTVLAHAAAQIRNVAVVAVALFVVMLVAAMMRAAQEIAAMFVRFMQLATSIMFYMIGGLIAITVVVSLVVKR